MNCARPPRSGSARTAWLLLAALVGLAPASGCATWKGARLYQRGSEALREGHTDEAIADLEQAARQVPQASEIQNHLGLAYLAAGRRDDALAAFRRAEALDCDNRAASANRRWLEAQTVAAAAAPSESGPGGAP